MPGDLLVSDRFPQAGDSLNHAIARIGAFLKRPHEDPDIVLTLAARLGTTTSANIDLRGYLGYVIFTRVTAVAGAGTIQTSFDCGLNGTTFMVLLSSAAGLTASHLIAGFPAASAGTSGYNAVGGAPMGRYGRIRVINSSAVGGNEVTFETSIFLVR
jgi:hypothetical protein